MTSEYSQQFQPYGFDYYTAGTQPSEIGAAPALKNRLRTGIPLATRHDGKYRGKAHPDLLGFEITLHDFSAQGGNHPEGPFEHNSNGFAWSDFVTHRPNELTPPPTTAATATASIFGTHVGFHGAYVFDRQWMGTGSFAVGLFRETSATDPTPTPIAGSVSTICSLTKVLDDGAERLAVGRVGAATVLISDTSGTVATTMHSSTNSCWGIIMSGVGTTAGVPVMLMYCGTTIGRKSTDADLTTAISTEFTGVNAGGFAVGRIHPEGKAEKAVWAIPRATTTTGALKLTAEVMMDLWVTDMELATLDRLELKYLPFGIKGAIPFRNGVLAHDDTHVVYWDGQKEYDLGLFRHRVQHGQTSNKINSDERRVVRGLIDNGPEAGVIWQWYDANATNAGYIHFEMYNFESGTWHNAAPRYQVNNTGASVSTVLYGQGGAPLSPNTRHLYHAANFYTGTSTESIRPVYLPRAAESLLWQSSLGDGVVTTGIPTYNTSNAHLGPLWWLDGIERNAKAIREVEFNGNLDYGGSGIWTFQTKIFGTQQDGSMETAYDKTFSQGGVSADYVRKNTGLVNFFKMQPYFVATASGTTRKIPQLLPIKIRGVYHREIGKLITETELGELA